MDIAFISLSFSWRCLTCSAMKHPNKQLNAITVAYRTPNLAPSRLVKLLLTARGFSAVQSRARQAHAYSQKIQCCG